MMPAIFATCVLLAAGFDWLEALLPFFFVAFWIVSQVFAVMRRLQGGGRQPAPPRQRKPPLPRFDPAPGQPRPPQPVAEEAGDLRSELEKQIAEFLREATGDGKRGPAPRDVGPVGPKKPVRPAETLQPQTSGKGRSSEAGRRGPLQPRTTVPAPPARERKKIVVPREIAGQPAPSASPERPQAEESVARHVQDVFSRELTHLRGAISGEDMPAGAQARKSVPTQAEELVHLLRNPSTIRQVILLREVLDRPVDRW